MPEMIIFRNQVLEDSSDKNRYRILYVPEKLEEKGYMIRMDNKTNVPKPFTMNELSDKIHDLEFVPVIDPVLSNTKSEEELSLASKNSRDRIYGLIKDAVSMEPAIYDRKQRTAILRKIESDTGVSPTNLYDYLGRWWRNGMTKNALLPRFSQCGGGRAADFVPSKRLGRPKKEGKNGKILAQQDYDNFETAIKEYYLKNTKPTLRTAYDDMLAHMYVRPRFKGDTSPDRLPPDEKPSFMQFYNWYRKNRDSIKDSKARDGENRYELKNRAATGKSDTMVKGPGMAGQIDATIGDYYLVRETDRSQLVGRPVIFFVRDVRSHIINGMHITLENASFDMARMALLNCAEDKVEYCRRFGVEISEDQWPCRVLPHSITADNGEMGDMGIEEIIKNLPITVENTPPYRGDLKAIIEKSFDMINLKLKDIVPGHVEKDDGQRGSVDRKQEACIDLKTFTAMVIRTVLFYNNSWYMKDFERNAQMREMGILPIPREIWNYGMKYESGAFQIYSWEELARYILPKDKASVTEKGIKYNDLYYTCMKAEEEQWFSNARINGRWSIPIIYNPASTDHIYLLSSSEEIICCDLLTRSRMYASYTEEELAYQRKVDKELEASYAQDGEAARTNLILELEKSVRKCASEKKEAGYTKSSMNKKNVRNQRNAEKEALSGKAAALREQEKVFEEASPDEPVTAYDVIDAEIDELLKSKGLM